MNEQFRRSVIGGLEARVSLAEMIDVIRDFKLQGLTQGDATSVLEILRGSAGEEHEDRLLEILDCVSGFCAPRLRIW